MSEPRKHNRSSIAPILSAVLLLALPLGVYVAGYYWLGTAHVVYGSGPVGIARIYPHEWQSLLFGPAARVESQLRSLNIRTTHHDLFYFGEDVLKVNLNN
jgi:hypothetical protein